MSNQDLTFKDQASTPKEFKPDVIDAGNGVRRTRQALANVNGDTINPATLESITEVSTKLSGVMKDSTGSDLSTKLSGVMKDSTGTDISTKLSGVMKDSTGIAIRNALLGLNEFEETVFTSPDGVTVYFRRIYRNDDESYTIQWTNISGSDINAPVGAIPLKSNPNITTDVSHFDVVANGPGYSIGNVIARIILINAATGVPTSVSYYNVTTGFTVSPAPTLGDVILQEQNINAKITSFPSTAATFANQVQSNAKLDVVAGYTAPVTGFTSISLPGRGWLVNLTTGGWLTVTAADGSIADKFLPSPGCYEFSDSVSNVVPHATKTPAAVIGSAYGRK